MSQGAIPEEREVAAALQRLLAWPDMARSAQLGRFLEYIVSLKLRGEADSIKAYSIAVDVFGRSSDFDPQTDPIVRVQARRLRSLLGQYYREVGADETVRIELPVGRYVPDFVRWDGEAREPAPVDVVEPEDIADDRPPSSTNGQLSTSWFVLAVMTLAGVIMSYGISSWNAGRAETPAALNGRPSVSIMEFQSLTGDPRDLRYAAGLAVELVTDLDQFETMDVQYRSANAAEAQADVDYSLSGIVRREEGGLQYGAILTESQTGSVIWSRQISLDAAEMTRPDLLDHVSQKLSSMLGSPRGPIHRRARALIDTDAPLSGQPSLYICRMMFDLYRERRTIITGDRAESCYLGLSEQERESGQAYAAQSTLILDANLTAAGGTMTADERRARSEALLEDAIELSPTSAFVWEQRALAYVLSGEPDKADAAYGSALQLNPSNTDTMASRARQLALMGKLDLAVELARRAIEDGAEPPPWYFGVPTLEALRTGQFREAANYAAIYAESDRELGPILAVMAGQGLGDRAVVNSYLPRVLDNGAFRARGILPRLRERIDNPELMGDISAALIQAGVPAEALEQAF